MCKLCDVKVTSGRMRQYATAGGSRHADEVAYTERHGFPRASRGDGFGNLAHAFTMLQQQHIRNAMWPYELTGSTGTVEDLHVQLRRPIVHTLYDWMQPSTLCGQEAILFRCSYATWDSVASSWSWIASS